MDTDKSLSAILGLVFVLAMFGAVAGMAQAATPPVQYTCPICGQKFMTYDELYQHFITTHPSIPIEIIWE